MQDLPERLRQLFDEDVLAGVATVVSGDLMGEKLLVLPGGRTESTVSSPELEATILKRCAELLEKHSTTSFNVELADAEVEIFFEAFPPPPKLVVVGGVHVAIPLVAIANTLGFHTVVVDARSVYATEERFPHADELIVRWPADALAEMVLHESTYCVFLTHDMKLDNPALVVALRSRARYVGALGSRKTHAKRVADLLDRGLSQEQIDRIFAPIGIKIGGNRPEEIAVSIAAEIVAVRSGRSRIVQ